KIRDRHNVLRDVRIACTDSIDVKRSGPVYRKIGDIGYVDLDRLERNEVDSMFDALFDTRAIVFDMRGYPHSTVWFISPRLNIHADPTVAALYRTSIVKPGREWESGTDVIGSLERQQTMAPLPPGKKKYLGKTVMLIDQRTMSQAEHTGLFLEAANGTKFVGS